MTEQRQVSAAKFERERTARRHAEQLLEQKSRELYEKNSALEALQLSLEKKVEERTAEALQSRNEALAAYRVKTEFIANISHELKTPLNAVVGFAEILDAENSISENAQVAAKMILQNSLHLVDIFEEILDQTADNGHGQLIAERFNLENSLTHVLFNVESEAVTRGNQVHLHYAPDLPKDIIADERFIKRVVTKLLTNLLQQTKDSNFSVEVKFAEASSAVSVLLMVNGCGEHSETLGLQATNAATEQDSGKSSHSLALGMDIARGYAAMLGGSVLVKSIPHVDCAIEFCFPVSAVFENTEFVIEESIPALLKGVTGKVLVVEDNAINQLLIKHMLASLDVQVAIAHNGEEGVSMALSDDFDLILMDVQMPVLDGIQATQLLRQLGYNKPIVAITAHVLKQDFDDLKQQGFEDAIQKPIKKLEFARVISHFLSSKDSAIKTGFQLSDEKRQELERLFIASLGQYRDTIQTSCDSEIEQQLASELHQLKGLCGNFHFTDLTAAASKAYQLHRETRKALEGLHTVIKELVNERS